ncbi:hypothetical protein FNV43_RR16403 [Rhamnella rubrinervis]|uniref:Pentatricopeptide repeat-containing protein n=1 Tax=Rhamnella rubrinervis TaxID=2594499 RepID=A0A8K0GYP9_9ROSA|nr:hypothetical protein FNV43_RR16403 [Rhamnella rubrinervis]
MVSSGFESLSVASKLITFYARFNDLGSAVSVFKGLREPNTALWNLIMKSHVDLGDLESALLLYTKMHEVGVVHDVFTFPIVNRALSLLRSDVVYAGMVHCLAIQMGFGLDVYFGNTMLELYLKCGCICYARNLFDEMRQRDLVSWTAMISGYVSEGNIVWAFNLFREMRMDLEPNSVTMMVILRGCCYTIGSIYGRQLHCYVIKKGLLVDRSVKNSVLKMYTKLGSIDEVESIFGEVDRRDVVSWNVLISFYSSGRDVIKVAAIFNEMRVEVEPSIETLTSVISAFGKSGNLFQGENLHCLAIKSGYLDDVLHTSLLDLYAKCGEFESLDRLFKEISHTNNITWSATMSGFIQNGYFNEAVELFHQMQAAGLEPSIENLRNLVDAYTNLGALQLGKRIHGYLIRKCLLHRSEVCNNHLETSILNMYIRCGSISTARVCFNRMLIKDVVTWTSMIEGYGSHGLGVEALKIFDLMIGEGITPNGVTFLSLLSACSHSGLVSEGCEIFSSMKWKFGIESELDHYTCMVDLLGRYGKLKEALVIVTKMIALPDSRIWGALFSASRVHNHREVGEYAAKKLLELEVEDMGYYTLMSNAQASVGQWGEVEEIRRVMRNKELKKKPGWSCTEYKGRIHGFVSGDRSHFQAQEIYEVLGCLSRMILGLQ